MAHKQFLRKCLVLSSICILSMVGMIRSAKAQLPPPLAQISANALLFQVAWSPNGQLIAVAGSQGVWIYNTALQQLANLQGQQGLGWVYSVAWSPDSTKLASAGYDGVIRIWNTSTFAQITTLQDGSEFQAYVAWSPDGSKLASLGAMSKDLLTGTVRIWNTSNWQLSQTLHDTYFYFHAVDKMGTLTWSPDSTMLAGTGFDAAMNSQAIYIASVATGQRLKTFALSFESLALSWNSNNKLAVGYGLYVDIYDTSSGQDLSSFLTHSDTIRSVAWNSTGNKLASVSMDSSIIVRDIATGTVLINLAGPDALSSITWSPDNTKLATTSVGANSAGVIQIWDVSSLPNVTGTATLTPFPTLPTDTPAPTLTPTLTPTPPYSFTYDFDFTHSEGGWVVYGGGSCGTFGIYVANTGWRSYRSSCSGWVPDPADRLYTYIIWPSAASIAQIRLVYDITNSSTSTQGNMVRGYSGALTGSVLCTSPDQSKTVGSHDVTFALSCNGIRSLMFAAVDATAPNGSFTGKARRL